jgi:hypothetical protein
MKASSWWKILGVASAVVTAGQATEIVELDWMIDPRPWSERRTKLTEIPVIRLVPEAGTGAVRERRYLLTAQGLLSHTGDAVGPAAGGVPESAYGKLLVEAEAWRAYGALGPQARANFQTLGGPEPLNVGGRGYHEVRVAAGANGNTGAVRNLAVRTEARAGAPAIGGFTIEGVSRSVLIRAVGPGLVQFGVGNAPAATRLQLFTRDTPIATNEDWAASPAEATLVERATARAGAFPLVRGTKDAAISLTLAPGAYTVHAAPVGAAAGTVLLEVYLIE